LAKFVASYAYSTWQQLLEVALSNAHRMPLLVPFEETEGDGAENENCFVVSDVGVVDSNPLLFALKENDFSVSGTPLLALPQ
jgi:hypothetical protein